MLLRTKLHHFCFPSSSHPGYIAMVKEIEANNVGRGHWMHAIPTGKGDKDHSKRTDGVVEDVVIDTTHIFGNQWNETEGSGNRRLFDWYQAADYCNGRKLDVCWGHWLEITPEMAQLRAETYKCGYCGKHYGPQHVPVPDSGFCTACIGSEYLKQEEIYLLRLIRFDDDKPRRKYPELTEDEAKWLVPMYIEHQTLCAARRETEAHQKAKEKVERDYKDNLRKAEQKVQAAKDEYEGMMWLWERGFKLSNVIYYDHCRQFGFGWRSPVSNDVRDKLLEVMSEFPYAYEIKCADGKKLERVHVDE
jgi:hypothetical protein